MGRIDPFKFILIQKDYVQKKKLNKKNVNMNMK